MVRRVEASTASLGTSSSNREVRVFSDAVFTLGEGRLWQGPAGGQWGGWRPARPASVHPPSYNPFPPPSIPLVCANHNAMGFVPYPIFCHGKESFGTCLLCGLFIRGYGLHRGCVYLRGGEARTRTSWRTVRRVEASTARLGTSSSNREVRGFNEAVFTWGEGRPGQGPAEGRWGGWRPAQPGSVHPPPIGRLGASAMLCLP